MLSLTAVVAAPATSPFAPPSCRQCHDASRRTWCSLRQTPAWYQSRSLRRHVIPLPYPISAGKYSQGVFALNPQDSQLTEIG